MGEVQCSRCGTTGPGLEAAPLPGEAGRLVLERSCGACWEAWKAEQVRQINEYRLSPVDPAHYERLIATMREFLRLDGER